MDLALLPELLLRQIFLHLDGLSLHRSRQVCRAWNSFILCMWSSRSGRTDLKKNLKWRWRETRPDLQPNVIAFDLTDVCAHGAVLLGMTESAAVIRASSYQDPKCLDEITLTIVEENTYWVVNIDQSERNEIFYRAEITDVMVAAVTDLGTVAVWDRQTHNLLHCKNEPVAECSLSIQAHSTFLLLWNERMQEFIILEHGKDTMKEIARITSTLSDSYILDLAPPHYLTESQDHLHVWELSPVGEPGQPIHSIQFDTFGLEMGAMFYPHCALTVSNNVANWMNGWTVQVWNIQLGYCVRKIPGSGYITDIKYSCGNLVLSRKIDDNPTIVVYDTEELVSDSSSPWQRCFAVENVSARISLNRTSLYLIDFDSTSVLLSCWNFWTCQE